MFKVKSVISIVIGIAIAAAFLAGCANPATAIKTPNSTVASLATTATTALPQSTTTGKVNPDENISVSLSKGQVNPGEQFTVNIMINTKMPSRGGQCSLNFDPAALQCNSVTEGGFFKDWATVNEVSTTMMPSEPAIDNTRGTVGITAIAVMGQTKKELAGGAGQGAQGSGVFLTVRMTAKTGTAKQAFINISNVQICDTNAQLIINATGSNGVVTVGTP